MTLAASVVFSISVFLMLVLVILKRAEAERGARYAESFRSRADMGALRVKAVLVKGEAYISELPFFISAVTRYAIHVGALAFARLARASARRAHDLADLVSHKHRFERRATKSTYLREVSEVKNGAHDDPVASA